MSNGGTVGGRSKMHEAEKQGCQKGCGRGRTMGSIAKPSSSYNIETRQLEYECCREKMEVGQQSGTTLTLGGTELQQVVHVACLIHAVDEAKPLLL